MNNTTESVSVLGADICKDRIVCWLLHGIPDNPKKFYKQKKPKSMKHDPLIFHGDKNGINGLMALFEREKNVVLAMEPSGLHYAKLFATVAERCNVPIYWVAHNKVKQMRSLGDYRDKNDKLDAFLIALYTLQNIRNCEAFVRFSQGEIARIRELAAQLASMNRVNNPLINRIKQQLAFEFPEVALTDSAPSEVDGLPPLYAWLAGIDRDTSSGNTRYQNLHVKSVAKQLEIEISQFSRFLATSICSVYLQSFQIESELMQLLDLEQFAPYMRVFQRFNFGVRTIAPVLGQIYPFTNFGSCEQFKSRLGFGVNEFASGDMNRKKKDRSAKRSRTALVLWAARMHQGSRNPGPEYSKCLDFYNRRMGEFERNPLLWEYREGREFLRQQHGQIAKLARKKDVPAIAIQSMKLELSMLERQIDGLIQENKSLRDAVDGFRPRKKGYKVLVQNQVAARAAKWLYYALKAELGG